MCIFDALVGNGGGLRAVGVLHAAVSSLEQLCNFHVPMVSVASGDAWAMHLYMWNGNKWLTRDGYTYAAIGMRRNLVANDIVCSKWNSWIDPMCTRAASYGSMQNTHWVYRYGCDWARLVETMFKGKHADFSLSSFGHRDMTIEYRQCAASYSRQTFDRCVVAESDPDTYDDYATCRPTKFDRNRTSLNAINRYMTFATRVTPKGAHEQNNVCFPTLNYDFALTATSAGGAAFVTVDLNTVHDFQKSLVGHATISSVCIMCDHPGRLSPSCTTDTNTERCSRDDVLRFADAVHCDALGVAAHIVQNLDRYRQMSQISVLMITSNVDTDIILNTSAYHVSNVPHRADPVSVIMPFLERKPHKTSHMKDNNGNSLIRVSGVVACYLDSERHCYGSNSVGGRPIDVRILNIDKSRFSYGVNSMLPPSTYHTDDDVRREWGAVYDNTLAGVRSIVQLGGFNNL